LALPYLVNISNVKASINLSLLYSVDTKFISTEARSVPGGIGFPNEIHLVHGWCIAPINAIGFTPTTIGQVDRVDFEKHVEAQ
jgi:hypothetical protein